MAWNMHLSVVPGKTIADFEQLGMFGVDDTAISVDEALQLPSPAVAQVGDSLVFLDGTMVAVEFNVVLAARLGAEVLTGLFSGVSDTYVWTVVDPSGIKRTLIWADGAPAQSDGEPLPEEQGLETLDEDALFDLLQRRGGLDAGWFDAPAHALASTPPPPPRKRGLFRRR
jgi:hypothetical protein